MGAWHVGEHDRIESVTLSDMYISRLSVHRVCHTVTMLTTYGFIISCAQTFFPITRVAGILCACPPHCTRSVVSLG